MIYSLKKGCKLRIFAWDSWRGIFIHEEEEEEEEEEECCVSHN
jgi:hypothetical protein